VSEVKKDEESLNGSDGKCLSVVVIDNSYVVKGWKQVVTSGVEGIKY